jgi:hypothetical protein
VRDSAFIVCWWPAELLRTGNVWTRFVREDHDSGGTNSKYVSTLVAIPQAHADRYLSNAGYLCLSDSARPKGQLAPLRRWTSLRRLRNERVEGHDQAIAKDSDVLEAAAWSKTVDGIGGPVFFRLLTSSKFDDRYENIQHLHFVKEGCGHQNIPYRRWHDRIRNAFRAAARCAACRFRRRLQLQDGEGGMAKPGLFCISARH